MKIDGFARILVAGTTLLVAGLGLQALWSDRRARERESEATFWLIAGRLREISHGISIDALQVRAAFAPYSGEDLRSFQEHLERRLEASDRWEHWAVSSILTGHPGTEFFRSYQVWLIIQGREFFEACLRDPAHAATGLGSERRFKDPPYLHFILSAARNASLARGGTELADLEERFSDDRRRAGGPYTWRDLPRLQPDLWRSCFVECDLRAVCPDPSRLSDGDLIDTALERMNWIDIYSGPEFLDAQLERATVGQRALFGVTWMRSEVNNGGYHQFFLNSTGVVAPHALAGLQRFGADELANAMATLMAAFPGGAPSREKQARERQLAQCWGEIDHPPAPDPSDLLYRTDLEGMMARYIRAHPEEFFRVE